MWFAAMAGPVLFDPICNATWFTRGRRGSTLIAACFSLAGSIGASRSQTMTELIVWRVFLGIGIGAVAAIVPVWESEVLPPAKRGRVLVSWQAFVAIGLLIGSGATYFFRNHSDDCKENYYDCKYDHNDRKVDDWWRNQILSGTIPTIILLILVYIGCESPRWLIVQEKYLKAFETLIELRKERLLAAEEFCYTYFQVQTERALARKETGPDFRTYQRPISYRGRLWRVVSLVRNRRALVATLIVMMTQTLSGIK
jgi:MFS family permease